MPGGMGVRSSLLLLGQAGNASQGTAFALQMILVALGIAVGLFASTLVVYPRKLLCATSLVSVTSVPWSRF